MNNRVIDNMAAAAEYINKVIEAGRSGDFGGSNCRSWYDSGIDAQLDCLDALERLKNEYESNELEAAGAASPESAARALKSYYRSMIDKCKWLCPYGDCGLYTGKNNEPTPWPVSPEWLKRDFDSEAQEHSKCALAWPIMRALEQSTIDADTASELLVNAYQTQSRFVRLVAALVQWWQEIEPSRQLNILSQYPKANTRDAQKYFRKAIDKGYMAETATGYKWLIPEGRGNKAALAYFLQQIYYPLPECELNRMFSVNRLAQAARDTKTHYKEYIDTLFTE